MKPLQRKHRLLLLILSILLLAACQGESSFLEPSGEGAMHIANLWWVMLIIGAVVYLQVISFLLLALFGRRNADGENQTPDTGPPPRRARTFIIANGIAIPITILTFLVLIYSHWCSFPP